ncbi:unnamed protein product [Calicophoron daubneyi]|uniref:RRM domain-containing protein n=1 Tax=Calicophoron daubneyi TaxID=300641 RepID=A0AAV2TI33_CALDB
MPRLDRECSGYRIFIGGLDSKVGKVDVEREFDRFGPILDVWVARNPPGFAFIVFKHSDDADRAVRRMHGSRPFGSRLRVERAVKDAGKNGGRRGRLRSRSHDWREHASTEQSSRSRQPPSRQRSQSFNERRGRQLHPCARPESNDANRRALSRPLNKRRDSPKPKSSRQPSKLTSAPIRKSFTSHRYDTSRRSRSRSSLSSRNSDRHTPARNHSHEARRRSISRGNSQSLSPCSPRSMDGEVKTADHSHSESRSSLKRNGRRPSLKAPSN